MKDKDVSRRGQIHVYIVVYTFDGLVCLCIMVQKKGYYQRFLISTVFKQTLGMLAVLLSSICYRHNNDNVKCKCCWLVCFEAITSQQRKLRSYNRIFFFSRETESCYKCSILILYFFLPNAFLFKDLLNHMQLPEHFSVHFVFHVQFMPQMETTFSLQSTVCSASQFPIQLNLFSNASRNFVFPRESLP